MMGIEWMFMIVILGLLLLFIFLFFIYREITRFAFQLSNQEERWRDIREEITSLREKQNDLIRCCDQVKSGVDQVRSDLENEISRLDDKLDMLIQMHMIFFTPGRASSSGGEEQRSLLTDIRTLKNLSKQDTKRDKNDDPDVVPGDDRDTPGKAQPSSGDENIPGSRQGGGPEIELGDDRGTPGQASTSGGEGNIPDLGNRRDPDRDNTD